LRKEEKSGGRAISHWFTEVKTNEGGRGGKKGELPLSSAPPKEKKKREKGEGENTAVAHLSLPRCKEKREKGLERKKGRRCSSSHLPLQGKEKKGGEKGRCSPFFFPAREHAGTGRMQVGEKGEEKKTYYLFPEKKEGGISLSFQRKSNPLKRKKRGNKERNGLSSYLPFTGRGGKEGEVAPLLPSVITGVRATLSAGRRGGRREKKKPIIRFRERKKRKERRPLILDWRAKRKKIKPDPR